MSENQPPPQPGTTSPDGAWRWDGTTWVPNATAGQQPYPPQGYGYAPQPPVKQSHTLRNVLLVIVGLFVLGIGGCAVLFGAAVNEVDNAIEESEAEDAEPGGPDNPLTIVAGEAFDVSGFMYQAGWTVGDDGLGDVGIEGLKFENTRGEADTAFVEIKFLVGNEVVASADCTSDEAAPGQVVTLSCFSTDDLPAAYDAITINDTF